MATPFQTLGAGNGFSFCLERENEFSGQVIQNVPTLAQTMSAYWNIDSISFGGATWNPNNEPTDLICDEDANVGSGENIIIDNPPVEGKGFRVSIYKPTYFIDSTDEYLTDEYLKHGLSCRFFHGQEINEGLGDYGISEILSTVIEYRSGRYGEIEDSDTGCEAVYGGPNNTDFIGFTRTKETQSVTNVTISGIPFIRTVRKYYSGFTFIVDERSNPQCPVPRFLPETGETPTITLHTY